MKNQIRKLFTKQLFCILFTGIMFVCVFSCSDSKTSDTSGKPYDPSKPITLSTFYPDSGGIATKVIIKGSNFGTDPQSIKVYYNKKPAAVVRAAGDMLYVITPRQPGDTCNISVVMGKDSLIFDQKFSYTTQITVTTICGKPGTTEMVDGTLAEAEFNAPHYLCVDAEKNIFVSEFRGHGVRQINEEKNIVTTLIKGSGNIPNPTAPATDAEGKVIFVPMDGGGNGFIEFDPETQWSPKRIKPRKKEGTPDFVLDYQHSLAPNIGDGMLYTRAFNGQLVKFNARTKSAELVAIDLLPGSDSFLTFDPADPNLLYLCYCNKHCIFTFNLTTKEHKLFCGTQNEKGWLDGEREDTQFDSPRQICFDKDGNLYIADSGNHVIRKVSKEGIVSTIIGIAGVKGYVDGGPDDALLNTPWGVAIDTDGTIYVGDVDNDCVRKLAIE